MRNESDAQENDVTVSKLAERIRQTFANFDVRLELVDAKEGLRAYHFHFKTTEPVRMSTIHSFIDDLRYELECDAIEIQAPILGKKLIGIVMQKKNVDIVLPWKDALSSKKYLEGGPLTIPLGREEFGADHVMDIAKIPHLLIGGSISSGKTVLLQSMVSSLVFKNTPEKLRLILAASHDADFSIFNSLPHLLTPVITDAKKTVLAVKWAGKELDHRFEILTKYGASDIASYHENVFRNKKYEKVAEAMPYIVIVVDEIADVMESYQKETEAAILRIQWLGRAVGIHTIVATERPDVNVVTGMLKANMGGRISLRVHTQIDSRVILDFSGAEKLQGNGDMLYWSEDTDFEPIRMQSLLISDEDMRAMCDTYTPKAGKPGSILSPFMQAIGISEGIVEEDNESDELYEEAKKVVIETKKASTSYLQRRLRIGYSRAARLMDILEERGVIGPADGANPREILG